MRPASEAASGRVSCAGLHEAVAALVRAAGTPEEIATVVADVLMGADLAGHDSHGVVHLPGYLEQAARGHIVVDARPTVLKQSPASALVDARGGWGAYGAMAGMELAAAKARADGVGAVSLANAGHIGRLGHYVEHAAAQGLVAMVSFGAGAPGAHLAAPFGGTERALSTNPIAFGVPAGGEAAFVLDYAMTAIAKARTWVLREAGEPLPPAGLADWGRDSGSASLPRSRT